MIHYANPATVHAPLGAYSHIVKIPEGAELFFLSGQLGIRPDGSTPETMAGQADQVFANIALLLSAHGLAPSDVVKLTTFIVAGHDGQAVRDARARHFGSHRPASTVVHVVQLADLAWFVEVEAVAAKSSSGSAIANQAPDSSGQGLP